MKRIQCSLEKNVEFSSEKIDGIRRLILAFIRSSLEFVGNVNIWKRMFVNKHSFFPFVFFTFTDDKATEIYLSNLRGRFFLLLRIACAFCSPFVHSLVWNVCVCTVCIKYFKWMFLCPLSIPLPLHKQLSIQNNIFVNVSKNILFVNQSVVEWSAHA